MQPDGVESEIKYYIGAEEEKRRKPVKSSTSDVSGKISREKCFMLLREAVKSEKNLINTFKSVITLSLSIY